MISLTFDPVTGECDLVVDADGVLVSDDPVPTAVLVSLFQDRRVTAGEVPEGVSLGGWWGDAYTLQAGDVEGSRLWTLLVRGREDRVARLAAADHAREALAWMLEDSVVDALEAVAETLDTGRMALRVDLQIAGSWRSLIFEVPDGL